MSAVNTETKRSSALIRIVVPALLIGSGFSLLMPVAYMAFVQSTKVASPVATVHQPGSNALTTAQADMLAQANGMQALRADEGAVLAGNQQASTSNEIQVIRMKNGATYSVQRDSVDKLTLIDPDANVTR